MTRVITALMISASLFVVPMNSAIAKPNGGNGPIIIKDASCEKKLVKKCHWEGNRHICVYVESNQCEMY